MKLGVISIAADAGINCGGLSISNSYVKGNSIAAGGTVASIADHASTRYFVFLSGLFSKKISRVAPISVFAPLPWRYGRSF